MSGAVIAAETIARAQSGDQDAIIALLTHVQRDIRRYARSSCRHDDIDDAVQEALEVVARHVKMLRQPAALAGWLFVVVARTCYRLGRRGLRIWQPLEDIDPLARYAHVPDADLRIDLGAAIQSLPGSYRRVVIARDLEGLAIREIAAAEGVSADAVKARLRRARTLLREYLMA